MQSSALATLAAFSAIAGIASGLPIPSITQRKEAAVLRRSSGSSMTSDSVRHRVSSASVASPQPNMRTVSHQAKFRRFDPKAFEKSVDELEQTQRKVGKMLKTQFDDIPNKAAEHGGKMVRSASAIITGTQTTIEEGNHAVQRPADRLVAAKDVLVHATKAVGAVGSAVPLATMAGVSSSVRDLAIMKVATKGMSQQVMDFYNGSQVDDKLKHAK